MTEKSGIHISGERSLHICTRVLGAVSEGDQTSLIKRCSSALSCKTALNTVNGLLYETFHVIKTRGKQTKQAGNNLTQARAIVLAFSTI